MENHNLHVVVVTVGGAVMMGPLIRAGKEFVVIGETGVHICTGDVALLSTCPEPIED